MKSNGYNTTCYGPQIEKGYPDLVELPYDEKLSWKEIVDKTQADAAIVMTKSRMWSYYNPFAEKFRGYWLPSDFDSKIIPKLAAEEDYMYEKNDDWYHAVGMDLLLQRHSCNALRPGKVPVTWAPFSVDEKRFVDMGLERKNRIARFGSASDLYPTRMDATKRLLKVKLLDVQKLHSKEYEAPILDEDAYIESLNSYVSVLVGTLAGGYPITPAKVFEIMSCGAVLLIDGLPGMEYIFPQNSYVTFQSRTDDVIVKARWIMDNPQEVKQMGLRARQGVLNAHTHKIRTDQLVSLIENRIWEKPLTWNTLVKDYVL
jgi:hypothetical protein